MALKPNKNAEKTNQHNVERSDFEQAPAPPDTGATSEPGRIIFSIVDGLMTFVRTNIFAKKPDPQCDESAAATSNDGRTNSEANSPDDASKAEFGKLDPSLGEKVAKYRYRSRLDPLEEEMAVLRNYWAQRKNAQTARKVRSMADKSTKELVDLEMEKNTWCGEPEVDKTTRRRLEEARVNAWKNS